MDLNLFPSDRDVLMVTCSLRLIQFYTLISKNQKGTTVEEKTKRLSSDPCFISIYKVWFKCLMF